MNRHASVRLRRFVDDAVGPRYDAAFARLDALVEGRCRCLPCHERLLTRCAAIVAELPALPELPGTPGTPPPGGSPAPRTAT